MQIISRHKLLILAAVLSLVTYLIFFGQVLRPNYFFWGSYGDQRDDSVSDAQAIHLPARTYLYNKIVRDHTFPFWTEKMYSGFPIYANLESAYLNPANVTSVLIFGPVWSYKILHLLEYLIGSLSLYFLLKRKGIGIGGFAVANTIFYFGSFFINHQIHMVMVMTFYLFPTSLLLADVFLEKRQLRYIALESLVIANGILWGHLQMVAIMLIGLAVYMIVYSVKKIRLAIVVFYFLALFLLVSIETLPQVLPTYQLFSQSSRSQSLDYLKGSLHPRMAVLSFTPYLFGESNNFVRFDSDYKSTEIYTYIGISTAILSFLALLFLKKSKEVILAFAFIWIFLLLGFMEYNNFFPSGTPIITLFRDWGRSAALSGFGFALLAGIFVDKINELSFENIKTGIWFVLSPLSYLWILKTLAGKTDNDLASLTSVHHILTYPYFQALEIITLAVLVIILGFVIYKKYSRHFSQTALLAAKALLICIVFLDLFYFYSRDTSAAGIQDISYDKVAAVPAELANKRVILDSIKEFGNESLYYPNWYPFGTSQLKSNEYANYYDQLNINLNGIVKFNTKLKQNLQKLKDAGVVAVYDNNEVNYLNNSPLDLIKNNLGGNYVEKKEGHIIMQVSNPADTIINTYLRYDPNWVVKVDGQETKITKDSIFFDFPLNQGNHRIEIYYFPKPFYIALIFSSVSGAILLLLYYKWRKNISKWLIGKNKAKVA
jgi:hypothetical protein